MNTETAYVVEAEPNPTHPGAYLVTINCPNCHRRHHHGAPTLAELRRGLGHRSAHCTQLAHRGNGYTIAPYTGPTQGDTMTTETDLNDPTNLAKLDQILADLAAIQATCDALEERILNGLRDYATTTT